MVRHKSRWLLVKIEQEDSVKQLQRETYKGPIHNVDGPEEKLSQSEPFQFIHTKIEKKNIYHSLSAVIQDAFGINGMGIVDDIQGEHCIVCLTEHWLIFYFLDGIFR